MLSYNCTTVFVTSLTFIFYTAYSTFTLLDKISKNGGIQHIVQMYWLAAVEIPSKTLILISLCFCLFL